MSLKGRLEQLRHQQQARQEKENERNRLALSEELRRRDEEERIAEETDRKLAELGQRHLIPILEEINSGFAEGGGVISSKAEAIESGRGKFMRGLLLSLTWGVGNNDEETSSQWDGDKQYWYDAVNMALDEKLRVLISGADNKGRKSLSLSDDKFYQRASDHIIHIISSGEQHHFESHHFHIRDWSDMT